MNRAPQVMSPARVAPPNTVVRLSCVLLAAFVVAASPARATTPRTLSTPTSWWHLYGVTAGDITNLVTTQGARVVDLEVEGTAPYTFSVSFVHNSGPHAVPDWWWYYDITAADVTTLLSQNTGRLIDLRRYSVGAEDRYACVMVSNTGGAAKTWWWYLGQTQEEVQNLVTANNARLVGLSSFASAGSRLYDVIMISNTGADQTSWSWRVARTAAQVASDLTLNHVRLFDWNIYTDAGARKFDVVMIDNAGAAAASAWWYWDVSSTAIDSLASQNGARVFDIESYVPGPGPERLFGALMLNNSNALVTRVAGVLGYGTNGATGLYIKKMGGPVLGSLQQDFVFEPASSLKTLFALQFMRGVEAGTESMEATHSQFTEYTSTCPLDLNPITESFRASIWAMLKQSDNQRAQFFRQRYGNEALNLTASDVVGMQGTAVRHRMGCGDSALAKPNQLTLADAGLLYEKMFDGTVLGTAWRDTLRPYFFNEVDFPIPTTDIGRVVDEEAAALGMTMIADDYKANIHFVAKTGNYTLCSPTCKGHCSTAGWLTLPQCDDPSPAGEYVFGVFVSKASDLGSACSRMSVALGELFREEARAGLQAWWNTCVLAVGPSTPGPSRLAFRAPQPNPAETGTTLRYTLPFATAVRLTVIDATGRSVALLVQRIEEPGDKSVLWDTRDSNGGSVPAGVYFIRLEAAGEVRMHKVVVRS